MANVVDSINTISTTMGNMLDFIAEDEKLSKDFEKYLEVNNIDVESEKQFNNIIIEYLLDEKMQDGLRVLEYFRRKNKNYDEVVNTLSHSFCSVFQIEKIMSNSYQAKCLTSDVSLIVFPLVKMSHLKHIGRYDYILARIVELSGVYYVLEIYDVISEFNEFEAYKNAIKTMLMNPKSAYFKNEEKRIKLEKSKDEFKEKFNSYFKNQYISTTNKKIDDLIENFAIYREQNKKLSYDTLIEEPEKYRYMDIKEFNSDDNFLANAIGGFSSHEEIYDVSLWMDNKRGLYIIPFLKTFLKSFSEEIENREECIKEFLTNDKIPPSVIKYAYEQNNNFFEVVNKILDTDFSDIEDLLFYVKSAYIEKDMFSPVITLYNSDLFSKMTNCKEEPKDNNIGRNELCPCGSGMKYKNCCGKN